MYLRFFLINLLILNIAQPILLQASASTVNQKKTFDAPPPLPPAASDTSNSIIIKGAMVTASLSALLIAGSIVHAAQSFKSSTKSINDFIERSPQVISGVFKDTIENFAGKSNLEDGADRKTPLEIVSAKIEEIAPKLVRTAIQELQGGDSSKNPELGLSNKLTKMLDNHLDVLFNEEKTKLTHTEHLLRKTFPNLNQEAYDHLMNHFQFTSITDNPQQYAEKIKTVLETSISVSEREKIPTFIESIQKIHDKKFTPIVLKVTNSMVQTAIQELQGGDAKTNPELGIVQRLQRSLEENIVPKFINTMETQINLFLRGENHRNEILQSLERDLPELQEENRKNLVDYIRNYGDLNDENFSKSLEDHLKNQVIIRQMAENGENQVQGEKFQGKVEIFLKNVENIRKKPLDPIHESYIKESLKNIANSTAMAHQYIDYIKNLGPMGILKADPSQAFSPYNTALYNIKISEHNKLDEHFNALNEQVKKQALSKIENSEHRKIIKEFLIKSVNNLNPKRNTDNEKEADFLPEPVKKYIEEYKILINETTNHLENIKQHQMSPDKQQKIEKEQTRYQEIATSVPKKNDKVDSYRSIIHHLNNPRDHLSFKTH